MSELRLTQTVKKGGCAAKVAAFELKNILSKLHFPRAHKELLVDGKYFDDAAIYKVNDELALVQTIDFFTPIIDTPKIFGKIAAANALSDVYAMGGKPKTCLAVLAFPQGQWSNDVIAEVLQGACDMIEKADANLVGGHSIDDDTLKFGLAVTGYVHPEKIWANTGAKPGDVLILTKALGTGTLTAALKRDALREQDISVALDSMCQLNNIIDYLDEESLSGIHAATDITGFGFSGHSMQLASASQVDLEIDSRALPLLPLAEEMLAKEVLTKAHRTNQEYTKNNLKTADPNLILHDPQTSGGLLLSVSPSLADKLVSNLLPHFPYTRRVGKVLQKSTGANIFIS